MWRPRSRPQSASCVRSAGRAPPNPYLPGQEGTRSLGAAYPISPIRHRLHRIVADYAHRRRRHADCEENRAFGQGALVIPIRRRRAPRSWSARVARTAQRPTLTRLTVLPWLSNAADGGLLWIGAAAVLATRPGPTRRAAARGLEALSVASAVTNLLAKTVVRRSRPSRPTPSVVRLRKRPHSGSFPSGHSAVAAAFATAVALDAPAIGVASGAVGLAVAWSRLTAAVHHPSDVLAGVLLGSGAAVGLHTLSQTPVSAALAERLLSSVHDHLTADSTRSAEEGVARRRVVQCRRAQTM